MVTNIIKIDFSSSRENTARRDAFTQIMYLASLATDANELDRWWEREMQLHETSRGWFSVIIDQYDDAIIFDLVNGYIVAKLFEAVRYYAVFNPNGLPEVRGIGNTESSAACGFMSVTGKIDWKELEDEGYTIQRVSIIKNNN